MIGVVCELGTSGWLSWTQALLWWSREGFLARDGFSWNWWVSDLKVQPFAWQIYCFEYLVLVVRVWLWFWYSHSFYWAFIFTLSCHRPWWVLSSFPCVYLSCCLSLHPEQGRLIYPEGRVLSLNKSNPTLHPEWWCYHCSRISGISLKFGGVMHSTIKQIAIQNGHAWSIFCTFHGTLKKFVYVLLMSAGQGCRSSQNVLLWFIVFSIPLFAYHYLDLGILIFLEIGNLVFLFLNQFVWKYWYFLRWRILFFLFLGQFV